MLELRPSCEHCNKPLPPESTDARICSYECTFCATCAEALLHNVCPNCGGGFEPRPVRPSSNWINNNCLGYNPASTQVKHIPAGLQAHEQLSKKLKIIPPEKR